MKYLPLLAFFFFFFLKGESSSKESLEKRGNLVNFFEAECGHGNVLFLPRKPGVNQLK
jgi:hypothetical protein